MTGGERGSGIEPDGGVEGVGPTGGDVPGSIGGASNATTTDEYSVSRPDRIASAGRLSLPDRVLYALFSRHADADRHEGDRRSYRATDLRVSFSVYLARVYGVSWVALVAVAAAVFLISIVVPARTLAGASQFVGRSLPMVDVTALDGIARAYVALGAGVVAGVIGKYLAIRLGGRLLRWRASARRSEIERTLPGAVRYLRALSTGSDGHRAMLRKVAENEEAYGEQSETALYRQFPVGTCRRRVLRRRVQW